MTVRDLIRIQASKRPPERTHPIIVAACYLSLGIGFGAGFMWTSTEIAMEQARDAHRITSWALAVTQDEADAIREQIALLPRGYTCPRRDGDIAMGEAP